MPNKALAPALQRFVKSVETLVESGVEESELHPRVGDAMQMLVTEDNWLDPSVAVPHPQYYQQYLLYADPKNRFSVVSFVWGPGQKTPIHDHTVWGVIGMLRGAETEQAYAIQDDGKPMPIGHKNQLLPGQIGLVSPRIGDVHLVRNAHDDQVSISIHAYGANIGKVKRHVFPPEGGPAKEFISGYSNPSPQG
jgi:predicted metal-dependent enzyme (double-stranded beta helix superfamily)